MGTETETSRDRNLELVRRYKEAPTPELANVYADELIVNNTNLIYQTIKKYYSTYYTSSLFEDLVQAGRIGIFQAINHFDPDKSEFATFFVYYIKGEINKTINKEQNKTTQHFGNITRAISQARQSLAWKGFEDPTISQLAEETGKPAQAIHNAISVNSITETVSIDDSFNSYSSPVNVELDVEHNIVNQTLINAIDRLPIEHRLIIYHAFGFINGKYYGDTAIAKILASKGFPTNPQRVKKLKIKALLALKNDPEIHKYNEKKPHSHSFEGSSMMLVSEELVRDQCEKLEELTSDGVDFTFDKEYVSSFEDSIKINRSETDETNDDDVVRSALC